MSNLYVYESHNNTNLSHIKMENYKHLIHIFRMSIANRKC
jgi:hypothetical protein